jgi:NitT/TauT family transport system substrate-binding protein
MPLYLTTINPNVKTIKDFTDNDRIALPAVKVSHQAVLLQMAAEQAFGPGEHQRLDALTVSLAHPDALIALLSGHSEITGHFGNAPFMFRALEDPRVRTILSSADVLGGPATVTSLYTTGKFRAGQPKLYRAVFAALAEAHRLIEADPARVARIYVEDEEPKTDPAAIQALLARPETRFSLAPLNTEKFADFMVRTGALRHRPASWRDYFFPDLHGYPGS